MFGISLKLCYDMYWICQILVKCVVVDILVVFVTRLAESMCQILILVTLTVEEETEAGILNSLTLRVILESIACYSYTFENNLGMKRKFTKYLKESCYLASDQHFSFKCFTENASVSKIFPKLSGLFWSRWVLMG